MSGYWRQVCRVAFQGDMFGGGVKRYVSHEASFEYCNMLLPLTVSIRPAETDMVFGMVIFAFPVWFNILKAPAFLCLRLDGIGSDK